jgi:creatinine amidohydrolase
MRPAEVQAAVEGDVPVLFPAGVVEYHGPHLPIGTDFLIARAVCERVAERCEVVRAPGIPFGPTGSWAGPATDGELDMESEPFSEYAKAVMAGIQEMGFERIYAMQHHQGEEGGQALSLNLAGYELWAERGRERGPGWGRHPAENEDEETIHRGRPTVGTIQSYLPDDVGPVPIGHGGMGETQLMLAQYPETVDRDTLPPEPERPRWLRDVEQASTEDGDHWLEVAVDGWVEELTGE